VRAGGFGVAVFERIEKEDINPNVAYGVGRMEVLEKPVCPLKDMTLTNLQADPIGHLFHEFNAWEPGTSIGRVLARWLGYRNIIAG
jgi:hypothetical protein